jgi:hypothetical protein
MGGRGPPLAVALKQGSTFPTTARRLMEAEEAPASSSAASPSPRLSRRACHPPASPSPRPSALAGVCVPPTSSSSRLLAREDGVPAHAEAGVMEVVGEQGRAPRPARREGSRRRGPRRRALLLHARGGELLRTCSSMRDPVAACWGGAEERLAPRHCSTNPSPPELAVRHERRAGAGQGQGPARLELEGGGVLSRGPHSETPASPAPRAAHPPLRPCSARRCRCSPAVPRLLRRWVGGWGNWEGER